MVMKVCPPMFSAKRIRESAEADTVSPVVTIFRSRSRPCLTIIGRPEFPVQLAAILTPLNYVPDSDFVELTDFDADNVGSRTVVVIDGSVPGALELSERMGADVAKILVSGETDFAFRARCARAHVSTVVGEPIDQTEFIQWLEYLGGMHHEQPASVLLVDDDPLTSEVYAETLRARGLIVSVLNDPFRIIQALDSVNYDIIIMDMQMPGTDGIEVAKVVRQFKAHIAVPILFLSAEEDEEIQMEARHFGGDDFITKRTDLDAIATLVQLRVQRARVMRALIERDGLTGLVDHLRFKERARHELARAQRTNSRFCMAMVDVDHFKSVNDTWGHQVGDHVLSTLARSLTGWLHRTDLVGRYGGEEFAVILLDTTPEAMFEVLDRFRQHFATVAFDGNSEPFFVTVSIGIAGSEGCDDLATLLAEADRALYQAKENGRNQVVTASPRGSGTAVSTTPATLPGDEIFTPVFLRSDSIGSRS